MVPTSDGHLRPPSERFHPLPHRDGYHAIGPDTPYHGGLPPFVPDHGGVPLMEARRRQARPPATMNAEWAALSNTHATRTAVQFAGRGERGSTGSVDNVIMRGCALPRAGLHSERVLSGVPSSFRGSMSINLDKHITPHQGLPQAPGEERRRAGGKGTRDYYDEYLGGPWTRPPRFNLQTVGRGSFSPSTPGPPKGQA